MSPFQETFFGFQCATSAKFSIFGFIIIIIFNILGLRLIGYMYGLCQGFVFRGGRAISKSKDCRWKPWNFETNYLRQNFAYLKTVPKKKRASLTCDCVSGLDGWEMALIHVTLLNCPFLVVAASHCDIKRFRAVFCQPQPNNTIAGINQSAH